MNDASSKRPMHAKLQVFALPHHPARRQAAGLIQLNPCWILLIKESTFFQFVKEQPLRIKRKH
jgi:hypothetical protein